MNEQITQEALNIMLADGETKDKLAETLDGVIENVSVSAVSEQIKAKNGSGSPESGVVEYKRFANAKLEDKGTARKAGKGNSVKAKPVQVVINTDKEIIEELQGKDVRLYGIACMAEKRKVNHQSQIKAYLDREFFLKVFEGTRVDEKETAKESVDEILEKARTLKNDYIDGIDSDMLVLVLNSTYRKALKDYMDELPKGTDPKNASIGMYDSVVTYESTRLPEGVKAVVMIDGAIAQPYYVSEYNAEKVPFDDAVALEDFLYKGTKALMEDTIFYIADEKLEELEVASEEGSASGKTKITVTPALSNGNTYKYKVAANPTLPTVNASCTTGYTAWNGTDEISATAEQKIVIVEVNAENKAKKAGIATVIVKA